jgi:hypothetical protein
MPNIECSCLETFTAFASATAFTYANNGQKVTASASATASSTLSYEDAYQIALDNANSIALSTAQTDANIINQSSPALITLENLSSVNNTLTVNDNSNFYYIKGSTGNSTNMPPTFFNINISNNSFRSMVFDNIGNLYVGLSNTNILRPQNGISSSDPLLAQFNNIAKWDGFSYSRLGSGIQVGKYVSALAVDSNNNLYVGGDFTQLGDGTTVNYIAKWNPTTSTWSSLGNGIGNGFVYSIAIDSNNNVYVGGDFTIVGNNVTANRIAKWDPSNSTWSALISSSGNGLDSTVRSIAIDNNNNNNNVYVGGSFTHIDNNAGTPANRVAKWTPGSTPSWSALINSANYNGVNGDVNAIAIDSDDNVYIGGNFIKIGGIGSGPSAYRIVKWDSNNSSWLLLGTGAENGVNEIVNSLAIDNNNNVYVGGAFTFLQGLSTSVNYIAKWNSGTNSWSSVGQSTGYSNGLPGPINYGICINNLNNDIYVIYGIASGITVGYLYYLSNDYINLDYNGNLINQLFMDGQIVNIFTKNINGNKICSVVNPLITYQNIYTN